MGDIVGRYILPHTSFLIPFIGGRKREHLARTAHGFDCIGKELTKNSPETVVLIAPHGVTFSNSIYMPDNKKLKGVLQFTRLYKPLSYNNDVELVYKIMEAAQRRNVSSGPVAPEVLREYKLSKKLSYGTTVPLYLQRKCIDNCSLVSVGISNLSVEDHYAFGQAILEAVRSSEKKVALIASGELSHRLEGTIENTPLGISQRGKEFDETIVDAFQKNDPLKVLSINQSLRDSAGECGLDAFHILLGTLDEYEIDCTVHSYEAPFGIGLMTATIKPGQHVEKSIINTYKVQARSLTAEKQKRESLQVKLARKAIDHYLTYKKVMDVPNSSFCDMGTQKSGVYVSIKREGKWQGCMGTDCPTKNTIAEEIIHNAITSAFNDPRFEPIKKGELEEATIEVIQIGDLEKIDDPERVNPNNYGLVVANKRKNPNKYGLILPGISGIETGAELYRAAMIKAGMGPQDKAICYKFKGTVYR